MDRNCLGLSVRFEIDLVLRVVLNCLDFSVGIDPLGFGLVIEADLVFACRTDGLFLVRGLTHLVFLLVIEIDLVFVSGSAEHRSRTRCSISLQILGKTLSRIG